VDVQNLSALDTGTTLQADLVIIGGGPAGLTVAKEFAGTSTQVLVLESGELKEEPRFTQLNGVESVGEPTTEAQVRKRTEFHGASATSWSNEQQAFGVRCRLLGGSTHAWAGKSAPFEATDFARREWVAHSGWPFGLETMQPYLDRAADVLNLGPSCAGDELWDLMGVAPPEPGFDPAVLRSFFWQFARSRIDAMDIMRFGSEFLTLKAPNVRVLLNATVTRIDTNETGTAFEALEVSTIDGRRSQVRAKAAVLAASGIENPRLLLVSDRVHRNGLGNRHDTVGRYLMDHPGARLGRFEAQDCRAVMDRFGFFGLRHRGRTHMYVHGLVPSPELQQREELVNSAIYMLEERAPDDPWDALKRLMRAKSEHPLADLAAVASSPCLLAKGVGMRVFESQAMTRRLKGWVVDAMIKHNPNFVVREYRSRGLPHKLTGVLIDGIAEQPPDPESRITLSERTDALGVPMARVDWRISGQARRTLVRLGQLLARELPRVGLPAPHLEDWVARERPDDSVIIDMGHTLGATRMSENPRQGVVDPSCQVHDVAGLYVAGGSVFPTSGHANPTLMILALAVRLADRIKLDLGTKALSMKLLLALPLLRGMVAEKAGLAAACARACEVIAA
jgi:choline dehydrogenase-like flavoprotein